PSSVNASETLSPGTAQRALGRPIAFQLLSPPMATRTSLTACSACQGSRSTARHHAASTTPAAEQTDLPRAESRQAFTVAPDEFQRTDISIASLAFCLSSALRVQTSP